MSESVFTRLERLPQDGPTVTLLEIMDRLVPGEWHNVTTTAALLEQVTGESSPALHAAVLGHAATIEARDAQTLDRVRMIFEGVDLLDKVAGGAAMANKVGGLFGALGRATGIGSGLAFLEDLTPKPETTQAIDAAMKLIAELVVFGLFHGAPKASVEGLARFVLALDHYAKSDLMRLSAWIVLDGLLPLGPHFMGKIAETVGAATSSALSSNAIFDQVQSYLPGDTPDAKRQFIVQATEQTSDWVNRFVSTQGLTQDAVQEKILGAIDLGAATVAGMDVIAAALDAATNYFSHTGTQTAARVVAEQAFTALQAQVWQDYLASMRA